MLVRYSPTGVGPYGGDYPDERPRTRGECISMPRPCPFATCKWHLAHDTHEAPVKPRLADGGEIVGGMRMRIIHDDPSTMRETCALDRADEAIHGDTTDFRDMGINHETARRALKSGMMKMPEDVVSALAGCGKDEMQERWSHWDEAEMLWFTDLVITKGERDNLRRVVPSERWKEDLRDPGHPGKARGSD